MVLPLAASYVLLRHAPKQAVATSNLYVSHFNATSLDTYSMWSTPAANESDSLTELLASTSFDLLVARNSPHYARYMRAVYGKGAPAAIEVDIAKNIALTPQQHILGVKYTTTNGVIAMEVINGFIAAAHAQGQQLTDAQATRSVGDAQSLLVSAEVTARDANRALADYMRRHGYQASDLGSPGNPSPVTDSTLASLNQQYQSDEVSVSDLSSKLSTAQQAAQSLRDNNLFTVQDRPTVTYPTSKTKVMDLALSAIAGLVFALIFIMARTAMDQGLRHPDDAARLIGLPVVAIVPSSSFARARRATKRARMV